MLDGFVGLVEDAVFAVALHLHLAEPDIEGHDLAWLLDRYMRLQRWRYETWREQVMAIEYALAKVLGPLMGQKVEGLPEWDDSRGSRERGLGGRRSEGRPAWWDAFERANPGRTVRIATQEEE